MYGVAIYVVHMYTYNFVMPLNNTHNQLCCTHIHRYKINDTEIPLTI